MDILFQLITEFWAWTELPEINWWSTDIITLEIDPLYFPGFEQIRNICIDMVNMSLTEQDQNIFLLCMALDAEEERILDACKEYGSVSFLQSMLSVGLTHVQSEARWQLAELLRKPIPCREKYLDILLHDSNSYVRQRANNVAYDIGMIR